LYRTVVSPSVVSNSAVVAFRALGQQVVAGVVGLFRQWLDTLATANPTALDSCFDLARTSH
jgi:hypothetical protein